MSRAKNTAPRNSTSKGDAVDRWTPSKDFHENYDKIFTKPIYSRRIITINDILPFNPCLSGRLKIPDNAQGTFTDLLDANFLTSSDKIWACSKLLDDKTNRLFAVYCAREALKLIPNPDIRSLEACTIAERFANGLATSAEREAASEASRAASWAASWAAGTAGAASEAASRAASEAASEAASRAAGAASWAASEAASRAASEAASRAASEAASEAAGAASEAAQIAQLRLMTLEL